MYFLYYILGSFIFLVFSVLYDVIRIGRVELTPNSLLELAIRSLLAGIAFFCATYVIRFGGKK